MRRATSCTGRKRWGCRRRFPTRAQVEQWCREEQHRSPWRYPVHTCPDCQTRDAEARAKVQAEYAESERQAVERRRLQVEALEKWAADALADPTVAILDCETTGLHPDARIVELSIITGTGRILLDTFVNPGVRIPEDARNVHGISDQDVQYAPGFPALVDAITSALAGRRTLIYNKSFDVARLRYELDLYHGSSDHPDTAAWFSRMRFEDVMEPYSDWVGEPHDYYGGYRWQALGGGHRSLGDCRAVIDVLAAMGCGNAAAESRE
ncbi:exonuclease [Streptomyces sp. 846.5]|nr:exonuclease [Streptomyces sp. 846.5]